MAILRINKKLLMGLWTWLYFLSVDCRRLPSPNYYGDSFYSERQMTSPVIHYEAVPQMPPANRPLSIWTDANPLLASTLVSRIAGIIAALSGGFLLQSLFALMADSVIKTETMNRRHKVHPSLVLPAYPPSRPYVRPPVRPTSTQISDVYMSAGSNTDEVTASNMNDTTSSEESFDNLLGGDEDLSLWGLDSDDCRQRALCELDPQVTGMRPLNSRLLRKQW